MRIGYTTVRWALLVALASSQLGCPDPDPASGLVTTKPEQLLDYNAFVCRVQPVLIRRCSFLACHGKADQALRIYSLGKLRLGDPPSRKLRSNTLLSADEVLRNFESAAGMVLSTQADEAARPTDPKTIPLLHRALSGAFGGGEHQGIALFPGWPASSPDEDEGWRALVAWAQGRPPFTPPDEGCQAFLEAQGLIPR